MFVGLSWTPASTYFQNNCIIVGDPIIKKGGTDYINNRFNFATFLWLSQIKDRISIGIHVCHGIVLDSMILDGR